MEKDTVGGERVSLKRKAPNRLFQEWLEDLHEEAKAKKSRLEPKLKQALSSLSKFPLPLKSAADCAILKGFDEKLCKYLDKNLEVYKKRGVVESDESVKPMPSSSDTNDPGTLAPPNSVASSVYSDPTATANTAPDPSISDQPTAPLQRPGSGSSVGSNNSKKSRKTYKPIFRSGSYALLLALLEHSSSNPTEPSLKKDDLIERAQRHSEESFVRRKPDTFYTAWSNMGNLVKKGLVKQVHSKRVWYSLTDEGEALARQLLEESKITPTMNDIIFNGASTSRGPNNAWGAKNRPIGDCDVMGPEGSLTDVNVMGPEGSHTDVNVMGPEGSHTDVNVEVVELPAGTFDIVLLIDKHETNGMSKKMDPTVAQFNKYPDLKHEYRDLKVGDFTWIARGKTQKDIELVLPFVVERKRMDDLGASVKDGRFHEQKFRLRKCGIKNVIYLIENYGSNKHVGLPMQSLMQALANTRVQDDFKVHLTDALSDSAKFLAMMTRRLTQEYEDQDLIGCNREPVNNELMTFNYFNRSSLKNKPLTVTDSFVKLLLQVKGVSVEKALAIAQEYRTPKALLNQYERCKTSKEGEMLLANIKYGDKNQNVGQSVSKSIYHMFLLKRGS